MAHLKDYTSLKPSLGKPTLEVAVPPLPALPQAVPWPAPEGSQAGGGPSLDTLGHNSRPIYLWQTPASRRVRRFFQRARSGLNAPGRASLLTLTSSPESPADINRSWQKLRQQLASRGHHFAYLGVKELTKSGLTHLHLLTRGRYMPQGLISQLWGNIHQAPVVDIRRIKSIKFAQRYLAKYLTKGGFESSPLAPPFLALGLALVPPPPPPARKARYWMSLAWMPDAWRKPWQALVRAITRHGLPPVVAWEAWAGFCRGKWLLAFKGMGPPAWAVHPPGYQASRALEHLFEHHRAWAWKNLAPGSWWKSLGPGSGPDWRGGPGYPPLMEEAPACAGASAW